MFEIKPNQIVREVKEGKDLSHRIIVPGWVVAERFAGGEDTEMQMTSYDGYGGRTYKPYKVILPPRWWLIRLDAQAKPIPLSGRIFVELEPKAPVEKTEIITWPFGNGLGEGAICWGNNSQELATGMPIKLDAAFMASPFTTDYVTIAKRKDLHAAVKERFSDEQIKLRGLPAAPKVTLDHAMNQLAKAVF